MAHSTTVSFVEPGIIDGSVRNDAHSSGVTWSAVIGGAFVCAAISLILLALGTGLGFSAVSPWANSGVSASTVGTGAIVWLILIQVIGSLMGGYLAGRLRTKWTKIHTDEVYFRDTAHGFLAWAVALVITAAFLASAAASMVGSEPRAANSTRSEGAVVDANRYFVDSLFRGEKEAPATEAQRAEIGLIFAR